MAVLAPERAEEEPLRSRPPSTRGRRPRPRRDPHRPLPDDRRRAWVLTAVLGVATLGVRLWGIDYPRDLLFDEAYYPPQALSLIHI